MPCSFSLLSQTAQQTLAKVESKLNSRLGKYLKDYKEDTEVMVKLSDKNPTSKVELNLEFWGFQLRAEAEDPKDMFKALDKAIDIMDRQIEKCKTKNERSKRLRGSKPLDIPTEEQDEYEVVRIKSYEMKPLTVQEAITHMDLLGHSFFMFFNSETNSICTVYRRNDGGFGLIKPE
jgi:putative sigma-54 modulation protein